MVGEPATTDLHTLMVEKISTLAYFCFIFNFDYFNGSKVKQGNWRRREELFRN